ncbi:MAG: large subunit ribosomal protein [Clostridia bacterium]|nr:large subunit ribosomal protein [Clostridia bacterium]
MPTVGLYNIHGIRVGEIALSDRIFGAEINRALLHEVVTNFLANRRQGTASTKTRGEVRGGGRKPWRQKGTGRARAGSIRSPIWRGGGIVFGPKPRDYGYRLPKKMRRSALCSALSAKAKNDQIIVLDELKLGEPRTKNLLAILDALRAGDSALLVTKEPETNLVLASRNLPEVKSLPAQDLNVYDLLRYDKLVLTKEAVSRIEEVL